MAQVSELPCNGDGVCMVCKRKPLEEEKLTCKMCVTPWHVHCLLDLPETLACALDWECPDCSSLLAAGDILPVAAGEASADLVAAIRAIQADESLSEQDKARRRQELMIRGKAVVEEVDNARRKKKGKMIADERDEVLDLLNGKLNCAICCELPERPVTTPCGHNFCLKCFQKWIGLGKRICAKCRQAIPSKMASQPCINSALVVAIRMAMMSKSTHSEGSLIRNQDRSDKAYSLEQAKSSGKANATSGKILVTVLPDHFGPITAENDPERSLGVMVGESWENRTECRQWGAHFPLVAAISGHSQYGAQSVVLSGYDVDDEDHGEWFFYTGSVSRDVSGNKQTNKDYSFDQHFEGTNEALRVSCIKGYPVRVVREAGSRWTVDWQKINTKFIRSHKEKFSSYTPEKGLRYDGIYRIEKCWQIFGSQGYKVCRYLFVRCDNNPAPWTSDEHGDRPRPLPVIFELGRAFDITGRKESASWDFDEKDTYWKWVKSPPPSRKSVHRGNLRKRKRSRKAPRQSQSLIVGNKLLKEFSCLICQKVMNFPITTPCAHNFCKSCLEGSFAGQTFVRKRTGVDGRPLRLQKMVINCPSCPTDISEFLKDPQVNRELMDVIESLKHKAEENIDSSNETSQEEMNGMDFEDSDENRIS